MGISEGGTLDAQMCILSAFDFSPHRAKLKLEDIFSERKIVRDDLKELVQREADRMVERRYTFHERYGTYVFSKDNEGNYFWMGETIRDRIMNKVMQYFF